MGGSGRWLKSLIHPKKSPTSEQMEGAKPRRKWRLWRSASETVGSSLKVCRQRNVSLSEPSDCSSVADEAFSAAVATVIRAHPKDFMAIRQEWASIRIQTSFRGLLARRALRALRAVVRIQAIFRGRRVRKQAAVTLRCMQALVRVQASVRAQSVTASSEKSPAVEIPLDPQWCDRRGTGGEQVRAKFQMRQEGAPKREKAMACGVCQKSTRSNAALNSVTSKPVNPLKHQTIEGNSSEWSWFDGWMAANPWESKLSRETDTEVPLAEKSGNYIESICPNSSSEHDPVTVRRNNVTTRVSAKPSVIKQFSRTSSDPISDSFYNDSSISTSSIYSSQSPSPVSRSTFLSEEGDGHRPSYMNLTESMKAKQRACKNHNMQQQQLLVDNARVYRRSEFLSKRDSRCTSASSSSPSVNLTKDLYPPREDEWVKS